MGWSKLLTVWKALKLFIIGGLVEVAALLVSLPPEQQVPVVIFITGLVAAIINALKHHND